MNVVWIVGVDIFCDKWIEVFFIYIYGVGFICLQVILVKIGVNFDIWVKDLEDGDFQKFCNVMEEYIFEGDLCCQEGMVFKCL